MNLDISYIYYEDFYYLLLSTIGTFGRRRFVIMGEIHQDRRSRFFKSIN